MASKHKGGSGKPRGLKAEKSKRSPKSKGQKKPKGETYKLGGMKTRAYGSVDKGGGKCMPPSC